MKHLKKQRLRLKERRRVALNEATGHLPAGHIMPGSMNRHKSHTLKGAEK